MQEVLPTYDVGVIIGRFQVHELHDAHRDLISHVCERHEKVIIILGISPLPVSTNNPLDFESRKQMLLKEFPQVNVLYVKDQPLDDMWSVSVDELVADMLSPNQSVVLYGSRDSFIAHYSGKFPVRELMSERILSGNAVRRQIAKSSARATEDFRAGVIWASQSRFPTVYTTVDIAIMKDDDILLGRKKNERQYRLIGGFADPNSDSFETDANREVNEEAGIEIGNLRYIGSEVINDWRYRSEPDCIKTMLFVGDYTFGRPTPGDDIEEVRWFNLNQMWAEGAHHKLVVPAHRNLINKVIGHLEPITKDKS